MIEVCLCFFALLCFAFLCHIETRAPRPFRGRDKWRLGSCSHVRYGRAMLRDSIQSDYKRKPERKTGGHFRSNSRSRLDSYFRVLSLLWLKSRANFSHDLSYFNVFHSRSVAAVFKIIYFFLLWASCLLVIASLHVGIRCETSCMTSNVSDLIGFLSTGHPLHWYVRYSRIRNKGAWDKNMWIFLV